MMQIISGYAWTGLRMRYLPDFFVSSDTQKKKMKRWKRNYNGLNKCLHNTGKVTRMHRRWYVVY